MRKHWFVRVMKEWRPVSVVVTAALLLSSCTHEEPAMAIITYTDGTIEKVYGKQEVYSDGSWSEGLNVDNGCLIYRGFHSYITNRCGVRKVEVKLLSKAK